MSKAHRLFLLTIALIVLFGLLALPALASQSKAPVQLRFSSRPDTLLSTSVQLTFTSASTIYLPIIIKPPNDLKIIALNYDAQDETVTIKNNGPGTQSFDGWQLVSVIGPQTYNFPNGIVLAAGQTLRIHSGPDAFDSPPSNLFWTTAFIWNNQGDKAELRDNQGSLRASFCYTGGCP